jgi:hypothetical protein
VKHRLPTLPDKNKASKISARREHERSRANAVEFASRPVERPELAQRVVAVAHVNQLAESTQLAAQLCAALVAQGQTVAGLATVDTGAIAPDAEAAFAGMLEAGVRQAKLVRKTDEGWSGLQAAVEQLGAGSDWIVAWGNALPHFYKPYFTVVVSGHRRELTHADPLVLQAQLEVTAPSPELATLLARKLTS